MHAAITRTIKCDKYAALSPEELDNIKIKRSLKDISKDNKAKRLMATKNKSVQVGQQNDDKPMAFVNITNTTIHWWDESKSW